MSSDVNTMLLASFPSPDRGVWYLGAVPIRAYALCIIVGIIVAIWWTEKRFVARGGRPGIVVDVAVWAVPFGLIGGRIYHVLTDWEKYFAEGANPVDALKIWQGGLGIWGAITLGGVGAWIGCRRRGVPLPFLADAAAPGIVVAQAIGRLGNWFNQELYGRETTLPWGLEIYQRVNPDTGAADTLTGVAIDQTPLLIVHPTFLYEILWNLGVAALVVWADRRFRLGHGRAFALYVAGYTAGRFWIEMLRVDPATEVFGVRINVITSVVVFVGAVVYLVVAPRGRETLPPEVAALPADGAVAGEPARDGAAEPVGDRPDTAEPGGDETGAGERAEREQAERERAEPADGVAEPAENPAEHSARNQAENPGEKLVENPTENSSGRPAEPEATPAPEPTAAPEPTPDPESAAAESGAGADEGSPAGRPAKGS